MVLVDILDELETRHTLPLCLFCVEGAFASPDSGCVEVLRSSHGCIRKGPTDKVQGSDHKGHMPILRLTLL